MRPHALALAVAAALALPATASAAFGPPLTVPVTGGGDAPVALAFGAAAKGAVVTQTGGPIYGPATIAVVTLPGSQRQTFDDSFVLDSVSGPGGRVDLLVRRGADLAKRGDLILRRVLPSGRVLDLWSIRTRASEGALARRGDRVYAVWPEGRALRIVSRRDGGVPTRPRTAAVGLRDGIVDVDVAVDRRDRLVAAVGTVNRGLLLASLSARGRVFARQVAPSADGLVEVAVTPGGRVGVLAEDTGIEGDGGECVGDQEGRHIRVAVREASATRFGGQQTIESPPFGCGSGGALLRATSRFGLTVLYQGGSYDHPPLLARAASAARGQLFGAPVTLASDARADTAVVTADGELVTALLRRTTQPELYAGALSVLGSASPEQVVSAGPAFSPLLATDQAGRPVLAWRSENALHVARPAG